LKDQGLSLYLITFFLVLNCDHVFGQIIILYGLQSTLIQYSRYFKFEDVADLRGFASLIFWHIVTQMFLEEIEYLPQIQIFQSHYICNLILWTFFTFWLESYSWKRGGRPTTSISSPNHILIIFSSEQHRNPRPFNIIFFKCPILENKYIFKKYGDVRA